MCRGCGHVKSVNLTPGTGLEQQDETKRLVMPK